MQINRSEIMKEAWQVVVRRRAAGYRETLREALSLALKLAWWDAKEKARMALVAAQRAAAAAGEAMRPAVDLWREIQCLEAKNRLHFADHQRLADLGRAYRVAIEREGVAA
jgi:hypothetical protein